MEAHPQISEGFCGMEIMGKHYAEKADAGEIILAACKETKGADPVPLGSYGDSRWSFPMIISEAILTSF